MVFVKHSSFKNKVLQYIHQNPQAKHSRFLKTYHQAKKELFWTKMKNNIKKITQECEIFQVNKHETTISPGLQQPSSILEQASSNVVKDFIKIRPFSHVHSTILVTVDRYIKFGHFITLAYPFTTQTMTQAFMT